MLWLGVGVGMLLMVCWVGVWCEGVVDVVVVLWVLYVGVWLWEYVVGKLWHV